MNTLKTNNNYKEPGGIWQHVLTVDGSARNGDAEARIARRPVGQKSRDQVTCDVQHPGLYEVEWIEYKGMAKRREVKSLFRLALPHKGGLVLLALKGDHADGAPPSLDRIQGMILDGALEDALEIVDGTDGLKWRIRG